MAAKSRKLIEKRTKDGVTRVENVDALLGVAVQEAGLHQENELGHLGFSSKSLLMLT